MYTFKYFALTSGMLYMYSYRSFSAERKTISEDD
jgi:hypothetical protein